MTWPFRRAAPAASVVVERVIPVEVPVLTEVKRRLGRGDVAGALRYGYPRVLDDLGRAYQLEFPPGFSHEEIVGRAFTEPMRPLAEFFDRLYALYAPVRFGGSSRRTPPEEVFELFRSLYAPEPMWRLYLAPAEAGSGVPREAAEEGAGPEGKPA